MHKAFRMPLWSFVFSIAENQKGRPRKRRGLFVQRSWYKAAVNLSTHYRLNSSLTI
jgi:hypothetical protein